MFGNIGKMMKLAGELKAKVPQMQEKLANSEFAAQAGGGAVSATVTGKLLVRSVKIDPQLLANGPLDVEMLEDLVKAAISAAQEKAVAAAAEAMKELTGGMQLPGMEGLL